MTNRIFAASYERGIELIAAGCPLDYPDALARRSTARRNTFRAEQLGGYVESRVYALGSRQTETGYVIGLRLGTDRPGGIVITDWSFVPPWEDHWIYWDYDPLDIIPKGHREDYTSVLDSPLMGVLNDHRVLRRGYPVEGLVCGCALQPIPESGGGRSVSAKLTLVDEIGNTVAVSIALTVVLRLAHFRRVQASFSHRTHERPVPVG